MHHGWLGVW